MRKHPQVVVLGGGILGILVAALAAERGLSVLVLRLSDEKTPLADTLRNHSWLHSGVLYAGLDRAVATLMRRWGEALLEFCGIQLPTTRGIYCFSDITEYRRFQSSVKHIGLAHKLRVLSDMEAAHRLGDFFESGWIYVEVPDTTFNEAALLTNARMRALGSGVEFRELSKPAILHRNGAHVLLELPCGIRHAPIVVVAAGAGSVPLLDALEVPHPLNVTSSGLLTAHGTGGLRAPLLVKPETGLSVAAHSSTSIPPAGRLVIGNGDRRTIPPAQIWDPRFVSREEFRRLVSRLPASMQPIAYAPGTRATAGYKTEPLVTGPDGELVRSILPWVSGPEFPRGLIAAVPVKATLALYTATRVLRRIDNEGKAPLDAPPGILPLSFADVADLPDWRSPVAIHHEPPFDDLDDAI